MHKRRCGIMTSTASAHRQQTVPTLTLAIISPCQLHQTALHRISSGTSASHRKHFPMSSFSHADSSHSRIWLLSGNGSRRRRSVCRLSSRYLRMRARRRRAVDLCEHVMISCGLHLSDTPTVIIVAVLVCNWQRDSERCEEPQL